MDKAILGKMGGAYVTYVADVNIWCLQMRPYERPPPVVFTTS